MDNRWFLTFTLKNSNQRKGVTIGCAEVPLRISIYYINRVVWDVTKCNHLQLDD